MSLLFNLSMMKTKAIILQFLLIMTLFNSCTKEIESDFRDVYVGVFEFTIHHIKGNDMDGNFYDSTSIRNGYIARYGSVYDSLLMISYGTDTIMFCTEVGIEKIVKENSPFKLMPDQSLAYPGGIGGYGHTYVNGECISSDSIELHISSGGLGFWSTRTIIAIRKR